MRGAQPPKKRTRSHVLTVAADAFKASTCCMLHQEISRKAARLSRDNRAATSRESEGIALVWRMICSPNRPHPRVKPKGRLWRIMR